MPEFARSRIEERRMLANRGCVCRNFGVETDCLSISEGTLNGSDKRGTRRKSAAAAAGDSQAIPSGSDGETWTGPPVNRAARFLPPRSAKLGPETVQFLGRRIRPTAERTQVAEEQLGFVPSVSSHLLSWRGPAVKRCYELFLSCASSAASIWLYRSSAAEKAFMYSSSDNFCFFQSLSNITRLPLPS